MSDELGFVDGQLAANGVQRAQALQIAKLAESGQWADALLLVRGNQRATRILERIRGMQR